MKKFAKAVVSGALIGITFGYLVALLFSTVFHATYLFPSNPLFVTRFSTPLLATQTSTLLWLLIGEVWTFSSWLFEIERWSITQQTIAHCLCSYIGMTPLAILCGWFPLNFFWLSAYTGIYILAYAITWTVEMYYARRKVSQLNKLLHQSN